jgi:hypothetical protein
MIKKVLVPYSYPKSAWVSRIINGEAQLRRIFRYSESPKQDLQRKYLILSTPPTTGESGVKTEKLDWLCVPAILHLTSRQLRLTLSLVTSFRISHINPGKLAHRQNLDKSFTFMRVVINRFSFDEISISKLHQ